MIDGKPVIGVLATCIGGVDLNGDKAREDFAAIVLDTSRNDPDRFGLVIFTAPIGANRSYVPSRGGMRENLTRTRAIYGAARLCGRPPLTITAEPPILLLP